MIKNRENNVIAIAQTGMGKNRGRTVMDRKCKRIFYIAFKNRNKCYL